MRALFVGGCPAPYHRMEESEPPVRSALEAIGYDVTSTGISHPDGADEWTGDYGALSRESLAAHDLVVLHTTGAERHGADLAELITWVRNGGALVGIHNAADSFTADPEYVAMIGARFRTHPAQLEIAVEYTADHDVTRGLEPFAVVDELYLFADYDPARVTLLAQTRSFDDGGPVPICWVREEGAGRVFYLSLGHNGTTLSDPAWCALFHRGVVWATRAVAGR